MNRTRWLPAGLLVALPCIFSAHSASSSDAFERHLDEIRQRLRAEAGVCEIPAERDADLPMVAVTVLPGDTHARLAEELTGSRDAEGILKKIEPRLRPGRRIHVPRALLTPRLADPIRRPFRFGTTHPTLWSFTRESTVPVPAGLAATVRNLQRLNHIPDPTQIAKGERIRVPRSLLRRPNPLPRPEIRIRTEYRVADLNGLDRRPKWKDFPTALRETLRREGLWRGQLDPREVDLVVIHTTEHRGASLQNLARYLQRKRLANYLIGRDGAAYEIVPETHRSHGCGQSLWEGRYGVDFEAINIEILADTAPGRHRKSIASAQYEGLKKLLAYIRSRRPAIHEGRIVTHRMVAVSYAYGTRSRKGDPYEFDWGQAGLPDNSQLIDKDVLLGRAKTCTDERYADRVTEGQTAATRMLHAL